MLLIGAIATVTASSGEAVMDAMAMLLIGHSLIVIRTGKNRSTATVIRKPWKMALNLELSSLSMVKVGGVLVVLMIGLFLQPFSGVTMARMVFGAIAIELLALLLMECTLRTRLLGNVAVAILLVLFLWNVRFCSNEIAEFVTNSDLPRITTWTIILEPWWYNAQILIGSIVGIVALLRWHPERTPNLSSPRPWLFA